MDCFGSFTVACSVSTMSLKKALTRPSTIFGIACSGLPSSRVISSAIRRSFSTTSAGTSSRVTYWAGGAAICCARAFATARGGGRQVPVGTVQVGGHVAAVEAGVPAELDLLLDRGAGLLDEQLDRL